MKKDSYISLKDIEPDMADEVKHKTDDMAGVVIAKYPGGENSEKLLDVRGVNEKIYYGTPAKNWEVTRLREQIE